MTKTEAIQQSRKEIKIKSPINEIEIKKADKVSKAFVNVLAILSIIEFLNIVSYTLFNTNVKGYIEALWLIILGLGFIIEARPKQLMIKIRNNLKEESFTAITTLIVGALAFIAGILSLPQINIQHTSFLAVKGIISIIAIIFIIIQTWVLKQ